jgi:hypothetical protein
MARLLGGLVHEHRGDLYPETAFGGVQAATDFYGASIDRADG